LHEGRPRGLSHLACQCLAGCHRLAACNIARCLFVCRAHASRAPAASPRKAAGGRGGAGSRSGSCARCRALVRRLLQPSCSKRGGGSVGWLLIGRVSRVVLCLSLWELPLCSSPVAVGGGGRVAAACSRRIGYGQSVPATFVVFHVLLCSVWRCVRPGLAAQGVCGLPRAGGCSARAGRPEARPCGAARRVCLSIV
jgi:hypothetical protein